MGEYLLDVFIQLTMRRYKLYRLFLPEIFGPLFVGRDEKEMLINATNFRKFIKQMISERREEMQQKNYVAKDDFLTLLLLDDLFINDEEMMIDECLAFMQAGTATTTMLMYNTLYYLTINPKILDTARNEIKGLLNGIDTEENWKKVLSYDELDKLKYSGMCLNESLRIEPPVTVTSAIRLTETLEIGGYTIRDDTNININIKLLHHNIDEW